MVANTGQVPTTKIELSRPRRTFDPRRIRVLGGVLLAAAVALQALLVARRIIDWLPVWAMYPDPGYQYLFAGGSVITGGTTDLIYHPGTSFQWLIGISLVLTYALAGQTSFMLDVASRPELYAQSTGIVLTVLYIGALAWAAWRMYRHWGFWPALLFQLLLLWGLPLLATGRYLLWPESLVLTSAIAALSLLAPQLVSKQPDHARIQAIGLGLISAVGLTAKVTFAPAILMVIILIGWRRLVWIFAPLVLSTAILLLPVYSRLDSMQSWFVNITTNPGRHGQQTAWDPLGNFANSMLLLNATVRWFIPIALGIILLSVIAFIRQSRADRLHEWLPPLTLIAASSLVLASGVKDSETRDFLLAIPLLAALAAITLRRWLDTTHADTVKHALAATAIMGAAFLAAHGVVQEEYFSRTQALQVDRIIEDATLIDESNTNATVASGYNAWTLDSSRVFGLIWSAGSFNAEVRQVNPESLHFDLFSRRILYVNEDNNLVPLTCQEMQEMSTGEGLSVVVESRGHIALSEDAKLILLLDATATNQEPSPLGDYFLYPLEDIQCT